jgi:hypothetical protein
VDKLTSVDRIDMDGTKFNDFPIGWRELTEKEFAQSKFFRCSPRHVEFRQMYPQDENGKRMREGMVATRLMWMQDKTGYALANDFWAGTVRYYAFGCQHDYRELSQAECRERDTTHFGMCWHIYECKKCGYVMAQDSSG